MPLPLPALSIPLNGHSQGGWHGMGHGTSTVPPLCHQGQPQGGEEWSLALQFPGPDLSHPSNNGRRGPGPGTLRDTVGQLLHMIVFSLGRKKKPSCKHKLHFLEKECAFPTCLFIYKPWEHWVPLLWGPWAPSGTGLCLCAPALH